MDPKLAMLIVLFGAIIGLSHLNDEKLTRMKQQLTPGRWRKVVPGRLKS